MTETSYLRAVGSENHNRVLRKNEAGYGYEYTPIEGVTIKCYKKSAAEYHAMYNDLRYELIDKEDG